MDKIPNFRRWLKRNRIFFDTFGTIALSSMAIIVSIGAFSISAYQATQAENENQPIFLFSGESVPYKTFSSFDNELTNYSYDYLVIKNEGKPFSNLNVEYSIISDIEYSSFDEKQQKVVNKNFQVPLAHYREDNAQIDSDGYVRIPQIFAADYLMSLKYDLFLNSFQNYIQQKGDMLLYIDLIRYLKIEYTDIYGKPHTKHYIISGKGDTIQISKDDYEKRMSQLNFSEIPTDISNYYLLSNIRRGGTQTENFNNTILEPWHSAFKKKFAES